MDKQLGMFEVSESHAVYLNMVHEAQQTPMRVYKGYWFDWRAHLRPEFKPMEQLSIDYDLAPLEQRDERLIPVRVNIGGLICDRMVPVWVYLRGWSFTRGWLKVGEK